MKKFSVLAVLICDNTQCRLMTSGLTRKSADAYSEMAAARRGCEVEFYPVVTDQEAQQRITETKTTGAG